MSKKQNSKFIKATTAAAVAASVVAVAAPISTEASTFKDVQASHQFFDAIKSLSDRGIINGFEDGTFKPGENLTRGQAAKIIAGVLGLDTTNVLNPNFKDIPTNHQYYGAIAALKQAGIIDGYEDGTFRQGANIQRNHVAKIIANALNLSSTNVDALPFTDVRVDYKEAIAALYEYNVTTGKTATKFDGSSNVTRGQMAAFITRAETAAKTTPGTPQSVTFKVEDYTTAGIIVNGTTYSYSDSVKSIFTEANKEALNQASIVATIKNGEITNVNSLTLNNTGSAEEAVNFYANTTIDALIINTDYVSVSGLSVTGNVTVTTNVQHLVELEDTTVNGDLIVDDAVVGKVASLDNKFANGVTKGPKVKLHNSKAEKIYVKRNDTAIETDSAISEITVAASVSLINVDGTITKVTVESIAKLELTGNANIAQLVLTTAVELALQIKGTIEALAVSNPSAKVTVGADVSVNTLSIAPGTTAAGLITNYVQVATKIVNVIVDSSLPTAPVTPAPTSPSTDSGSSGSESGISPIPTPIDSDQTAIIIDGLVSSNEAVAGNELTVKIPSELKNQKNISIQWYRADNKNDVNKNKIEGATGINYTPTSKDVRKYLSVEVKLNQVVLSSNFVYAIPNMVFPSDYSKVIEAILAENNRLAYLVTSEKNNYEVGEQLPSSAKEYEVGELFDGRSQKNPLLYLFEVDEANKIAAYWKLDLRDQNPPTEKESFIEIRKELVTQYAKVWVGINPIKLEKYSGKDEAKRVAFYLSKEPDIKYEDIKGKDGTETFSIGELNYYGVESREIKDSGTVYVTSFILNNTGEVIDTIVQEIELEIIKPIIDEGLKGLAKEGNVVEVKEINDEELELIYTATNEYNPQYYSAHYSYEEINKSEVLKNNLFILSSIENPKQRMRFNPKVYLPEGQKSIYTLMFIYDSEYNVIGYYEKEFTLGDQTAPTDTTSIDTAIIAATAAKEGVVEATTADTVLVGKNWVTPAEMTALTDAITAAINAMITAETEVDLTNAVTELNKAVDKFNLAKKNGTKEDGDQQFNILSFKRDYNLDEKFDYEYLHIVNTEGNLITINQEDIKISGFDSSKYELDQEVTLTVNGRSETIKVNILPAAPNNLIKDDNLDIILGLDKTMEYKIENTNEWIKFDGNNILNLSGDTVILIRYSSTAERPYSHSQYLMFSADYFLLEDAAKKGEPTDKLTYVWNVDQLDEITFKSLKNKTIAELFETNNDILNVLGGKDIKITEVIWDNSGDKLKSTFTLAEPINMQEALGVGFTLKDSEELDHWLGYGYIALYKARDLELFEVLKKEIDSEEGSSNGYTVDILKEIFDRGLIRDFNQNFEGYYITELSTSLTDLKGISELQHIIDRVNNKLKDDGDQPTVTTAVAAADLGFTSTTATSADNEKVKVEVKDGEVVLTAVAAGTTTVEITDGDQESVTYDVTVTADGQGKLSIIAYMISGTAEKVTITFSESLTNLVDTDLTGNALPTGTTATAEINFAKLIISFESPSTPKQNEEFVVTLKIGDITDVKVTIKWDGLAWTVSSTELVEDTSSVGEAE